MLARRILLMRRGVHALELGWIEERGRAGRRLVNGAGVLGGPLVDADQQRRLQLQIGLLLAWTVFLLAPIADLLTVVVDDVEVFVLVDLLLIVAVQRRVCLFLRFNRALVGPVGQAEGKFGPIFGSFAAAMAADLAATHGAILLADTLGLCVQVR